MKNQETTFWHTRNRQRIEQQRVTNSLDLINLRAKQQHKKRWNDLSEISEDSNDDYLDEMIADEITSVVSEKSDKDSIGNLATKNEMIKEMMSLYQCGENLKQRVRIICVGGGLYAYNGVCYDKVDNNELMTIYRDKVDKTLHNSKSLNVMGNLYKFLQTDSEIQATIDYSAVDDLAVLKNGVFDVRNQKLMKHSEKYMFMYRINASYTMEDETPLFDEFLENVTGGESVLIKRMWYLIAYLCMHSVAAKCFFVLGTAPNSGKSVFGRFIQSLFDAKFVSSIALNDMNREFSLGPIVGKAVNVSMDLPATKLNAAAVSKLKMLTGDDMITINEKHVPEFSYYNRAKGCSECAAAPVEQG